MAFYELETKDRKYSVSYFEIYWCEVNRNCLTLERAFNIHFQNAYEVSKQYNTLQNEFVNDLQSLQNDFYDWSCGYAVEHNIIKNSLPKDTNYKIQEAELKKIYDWFLPKQRAFADKWGLVVNVD